nr:hypothetical protein [Ferrimicrobium acidiphilum]
MSEQSQEVTYYKPAIPKVEGLELKPAEIGLQEELRGLVGSDGLIKTELETDVVLSRIAKDIYKDFLAGYRETYANAVTACQRAVDMFKASPHIEVTLDMDTRLLEIKEIDSTGITPAEFRDIYRVVGRTGNADGTRLGQFGFGRLAWVSLSDRMVLETKFRTIDGKTGTYAFENKEGRAFAPITPPEIGAFGTTHRFYLYDNIDLATLLEYIKSAGAMVHTKTTLKIVKQFNETVETLNKTPAELLRRDQTNDSEIRMATEILSYKDDDIELYGVLEIVGWNNWNQKNKEIEFGNQYRVEHDHPNIYLLGMPIQSDYRIPMYFSRCIINVLNERKFQPTADRDRFREDATEALNQKIKDVVSNLLQTRMNMKTLADYMALPKVWKLVLGGYRTNMDLGAVVQFVSSYVSLKGSNEHWKVNVAKILNTTSKTELFYQLNRVSQHYLNKAKSLVPGAVAMTIRSVDQAKLLDDYGVKNLKTMMGMKKGTITPSDFVVYSAGWGGTTRQRIEPSKLTQNTIKIPAEKHLEPYTTLLNSIRTDYQVTRDSAFLSTIGVGLEAFLKNTGNKKVTTSSGDMLVKNIPKNVIPIIGIYDIQAVASLIFGKLTLKDLFDDEKPELWNDVKTSTPLLGILTDKNTAFELILYFSERKQKYVKDFDGHRVAAKILGATETKYTNYRSSYYQQLWARLHINAVCKDPELDSILQVIIDNTNDFNMMQPRRDKIIETLDRLQSGGKAQGS